MNRNTPADFSPIGKAFNLPGELVEAIPYGSGHINDTFRATCRDAGRETRYILQRINHNIFKNPVALMDNIQRVTEHVRSKWAETSLPDRGRRALTLVKAADGQPLHQDAEGSYWRTYVFVEGASTYDVLQTPAQAREAAYAFGRFQAHLVDLPGPRLHETIPHFHDTPKRLDTLLAAVERDPCKRKASIKSELDFVLARAEGTRRLQDLQRAGRIPERITHNDTKLNNVMLDDQTGEGVCVIDLDTVMPGLALYDFGDMMRTALSPAAEDERDTSKVAARLEVFEALADGYLAAAGAILTPDERAQLVFSGQLITLETAIRFLTDYLEGDRYFKIHRPDHNLDRARTQIALIRSMEEQDEAMQRTVLNCLAKLGS